MQNYDELLVSLRKVIRPIDLHSKQLINTSGLSDTDKAIRVKMIDENRRYFDTIFDEKNHLESISENLFSIIEFAS